MTGELGVGLLDCSGEGHGAGEIFEDDGFEAKLSGGEGREAYAEVVGYACEEEAFQAAFAR